MELTMKSSFLHKPSSAVSLFRVGPRSTENQSGAALIVGLIFLVILTVLGVAAMQNSTLEERMAGNARDRNVAFQAAEAALRDAERDTRCQKSDGNAATVLRTIGCISGMTGADSTCTDGLCCSISAPGLACTEVATPVDQDPTLSLIVAPSVRYGTYTAATDLTGVAAQPRYLIEPFQKGKVNYFRITSRGYGANAATQVTLQEIFKE
jgi:type IV pilus assembly protein PilX